MSKRAVCPHCRQEIVPTFGLTPKQKLLLDLIRAHFDVSDFAPTYEEMKEVLGVSNRSHIARLIKALEERGYITRLPNRARSIRLVGEP